MASSQKTVLVAEDEVLIRLMAVELLSEAGFTVLEAEHAASALRLLAEHAVRVHLLCTDIHMPGEMDGLALAHHASSHWPWVALIIVSGEAHPAEHELPEGSRFLSKPYGPGHLVASVRELLA